MKPLDRTSRADAGPHRNRAPWSPRGVPILLATLFVWLGICPVLDLVLAMPHP
jgi:hypothetical protein